MYGCLHYRAELCVRTALRGRYYVYPLQRLSAIAVKRRYYYYYYTTRLLTARVHRVVACVLRKYNAIYRDFLRVSILYAGLLVCDLRSALYSLLKRSLSIAIASIHRSALRRCRSRYVQLLCDKNARYNCFSLQSNVYVFRTCCVPSVTLVSSNTCVRWVYSFVYL